MKIEDLSYVLPTEPVNEKEFDLEKWRKENPVDYLKLLYILRVVESSYNGKLRNLAMKATFDAIHAITRHYIPNTLYKFISLTNDDKLNEKKFQTLQAKQIFMSEIKEFNDPFDGKAFYYDAEKLKGIGFLNLYNGRLIDDFTVYHRATAMTENDINCMPMWAHYSNNHRGFCVEYDMKNPDNLNLSACTFPVQYTDQRLDVTSLMVDQAKMIFGEIDKHMVREHQEFVIKDLSIIYMAVLLCNIKHASWQYEKEFRCTMGATAKGMPYVNAMPKAIYIGMNCIPSHRHRLKEIANALQIPVYEMFFEEYASSFNLAIKKI